MDSVTLKSLAEEHCKKFAAVGANSKGKDIDTIATEYVQFLAGSGMSSYHQFGVQTYTSRATAVEQMRAWLISLDQVGISPQTGIAIKDWHVEVFSSSTAFCRFTNIFTPNDAPPIEFEQFMLYSVPQGETKGSWIINLGHAQVDAMLERYPKFFDLPSAPNETKGTMTV